MNKLRHNRLTPLLILSAAFLLRAVIPAGYMPAAGSGLWFELCPEALPTSVMQSLTGESAHEHGHMDHGDSGDDNHQCPVGHMLSSAAAVDHSWQAEAAPILPALHKQLSYSFATVSRTNYHSRGPPA